MKHWACSRRLEVLESEIPGPEELKAQRHQGFLSKLVVWELRRLRAIIVRTGGDRNKLAPGEVVFLEGLKVKYETEEEIDLRHVSN